MITSASTSGAAAYGVEETPLSTISADLAARRVTSIHVTKAYIDRIKAFDHLLHAIIRIAPDALEKAAASDKRRSAGTALGPLDGVPILLKDNIDAVGMPTTAGSYALIENYPARDAEVTRRLRAAGAIIIGKSNLNQFSEFRTTHVFNGSTVGGVTRNPYDLTRTPSGSSSGSAVAAAVSFAAGAIGTETAGSVVSPASMNGLVGLKPTVGLVSRRGIVPISLNQDTAGPMTRSVADAAIILNAIAGSDTDDIWSKYADVHEADFVKALDPTALKGKRIGIVRDIDSVTSTTTPLLEAAIKVMTTQGVDAALY
ncbi:amidase family protein [Mesorhizobium mediterraneum]|uniref:amidase family protein n=1 Tax=Mesorhizobium mediterraneum TaxID=43617 RepID=UPI00177C1BB3|nr:amidase family protein [Mesorhizobium mediterraneum]